jgi:hypothetical protein
MSWRRMWHCVWCCVPWHWLQCCVDIDILYWLPTIDRFKLLSMVGKLHIKQIILELKVIIIINTRVVWLLNLWLLDLHHGILSRYNIKTRNSWNWNKHLHSKKIAIDTKIIMNNINNDNRMNNTSNNTSTSFTNKNTIISIMMLNFIFSTNLLYEKKKVKNYGKY